MSIKDALKKELADVLLKMGLEGIEPSVEVPADSKHGDYSSNVALIAAKKLNQPPMMVGAAIKMALDEKDIHFLSNIEVVPPGFINFRISNSYLLLQLPAIVRGKTNLEKRDRRGADGKNVVVEYSSPNIAKPFTVGHLRSTIIGDAVANLLEATGWEVHRDNHLGDWGTQFGKQIYAIKAWGDEEKIDKSERPVKELVELYVKFHEFAQKDPSVEDKAREWFRQLEEGDSEARRLWKKCIDWSWKEFDTIYKELDVRFDENNGRGYGESFFEDKMDLVIAELEEKRLLKKGEEGAKLVFFPDDKYPPLMILKKDGSTLYATRDLATDKFRLERYGNDVLVINEVGAEQSLYMQQIFAVEQMLGWYKEGQRAHIKHGLYRFKDQKMSTRKGNVIWLEDVLAEAKSRAKELGGLEGEKGLEAARAVAVGAIKWNDLKRDSKQDIIFDWDDILNMQGNSGPYMQYAYARTQSILRKSQTKFEADTKHKTQNTKYELHPEERHLLRLLSQLEEIVESAAQRYAPSILCTYLFELAQAFNLFYQKHQILKAEGESKHVRLALTEGTGSVLKRGLHLLGIHAPVKM